MFYLTYYFLLSRNKNTENVFSNENVFLDLFKLVSTEKKFYCFQFVVRLEKYFH